MHKNQRTALFSIQMLISGAFYHKAFFAANYTCLQNLIESRGCIMDTFLPHAIVFAAGCLSAHTSSCEQIS